jgi:ubiquinone/menaquinone biosynthesis C-methylase UbiE
MARTSTPQASIDAAEAYEQLFVPALFREWAPRTLAASRARPGSKLLDVACGTGIVAREAVALVGDNGSVTGLDPNAGMLSVAARLAPRIDWREGVAESLPFPDGAFDVVVTQFGFMFFKDRVEALREMTRVLSPGGCLAVVVWDDIKLSPPYAVLASLLEKQAGRQAADALYAPFSLGDRRKLEEPFTAANIQSVEVTTQVGRARFPSLRSLVDAELRGWLPVMGVQLREEQIQSVFAEAAQSLGHFMVPDGQVVFDMSAHIASANAPERAQ